MNDNNFTFNNQTKPPVINKQKQDNKKSENEKEYLYLKKLIPLFIKSCQAVENSKKLNLPAFEKAAKYFELRMKKLLSIDIALQEKYAPTTKKAFEKFKIKNT